MNKAKEARLKAQAEAIAIGLAEIRTSLEALKREIAALEAQSSPKEATTLSNAPSRNCAPSPSPPELFLPYF
jgi:hypothetical protein